MTTPIQPTRHSTAPRGHRGADRVVRRRLLASALVLASAGLSAAEPDIDWSLLDTYCSECHNFDDQAGGVAFDILPHDKLVGDAHVWELALTKLRTGLMPPAGKERPPQAMLASFQQALALRLDNEQGANPNPGNEGMGRLNRAEYTNAIRDILGYDAAALVSTLPADVSVDGFDNIAEGLSVSPTLIDSYVGVAMRIAREAVGDRAMIPTQVSYPGPGPGQSQHVDGLPLGTRGGMLVTHNFPLDAKYEIRVRAQGAGGVFNNQAFCQGPRAVVMIDGKPVDDIDPASFQLPVTAGPHDIAVALLDDKRCEGVNEFYDVYVPSGAIGAVEIHGPFESAGAGDTPSRRAIFSCMPTSASEEDSCAREIISRLATRAFRRPIAESDTAVDSLMNFYAMGKGEGDFETGIQYAISRMLIDPRFLYQAEAEPEGLAAGEIYRISDLELASRLSFFLWSSIPDEALLASAAAGRLGEADELERQVRRMLADPKAEALVDNFAGQWLKLRELDAALPQDNAFDASLRTAFREETRLLFGDMVRENLPMLHLLDPGYTWLNARLARHYGIDGVRGDYMRRVPLPDESPRGSLLGHGSLLTATSVANRTSPVVRGAWIVENLLGAPVPLPPPGVETDLSQDTVPEGYVVHTLRERLELHRANPSCAACHKVMDPLGFALENLDLVGRWRDTDNGYPVDSASTLFDGTPIDGPVAMREALLQKSDAIVSAMTVKLMTYGLGRKVEASDMPAVRAILRETAANDYRFVDVVAGITRSLPFQYKIAEGEPAPRVAGN